MHPCGGGGGAQPWHARTDLVHFLVSISLAWSINFMNSALDRESRPSPAVETVGGDRGWAEDVVGAQAGRALGSPEATRSD